MNELVKVFFLIALLTVIDKQTEEYRKFKKHKSELNEIQHYENELKTEITLLVESMKIEYTTEKEQKLDKLANIYISDNSFVEINKNIKKRNQELKKILEVEDEEK